MNSKQRRTEHRKDKMEWLEAAASKLAGALDAAIAMQPGMFDQLPEFKAALKFFDDGPDAG